MGFMVYIVCEREMRKGRCDMAKLTDAWIEELRARVDIVDVVSDYVALKQKGSRYWGLCPFHREKTPSFSVDTEKQMYYCYGCHKGGDIIRFIRDQERMEFMDAIKLLAERAHMDVPEGDATSNSESRAAREKMFEANVAAARFYHAAIWTEAGAQALTYLYRRGLDDADIRRFGLGSTAGGWESLTEALLEEGFSQETLVGAGLSKVSADGRLRDMFFDRAMFPIINQRGRVVGFGGRMLGKGEPKYLNTADTPIFNKRNGLYAMNFVKKERSLKRAILVEGYMDVVSLRRQGVEGVFATLGTALTQTQARLIKRYAPEVWVAYDGDEPGQVAIERAVGILQGENVPCRVLRFPEGMDPDDYISKNGAEAFAKLEPIEAIRFLCERQKRGVDISTEEGREQYAIACCGILKRVTSPVELERHVKWLAMETGFSRDVLMRQIELPSGGTESALRRDTTSIARRKPPETECERAEKKLVMLLAEKLISPSILKPQDFETRLYADLARMLIEGLTVTSALDKVPEEERERAASALFDEVPPEEKNAMTMAEDCLRCIRLYRMDRSIRELEEEAKSLSGEARRKILEKIAQLHTEQEKLKKSRKEWVG